MEEFKKIYDMVIEHTNISILRQVDLEFVKERLMELDMFDGVSVFNVVDRTEDVKIALFDPKIHKFNSVVNINTIQMMPNPSGGLVLMVNCLDGTVIRGDE